MGKIRTAEMLRMRQKGLTLQEIGDIFGVTRERVRQIVGRQFKPKSQKERLSKFIPQFLKLRKNHTYKEIAKKFNTRHSVVESLISKEATRLGIQYRKYPEGYLRCYSCHEVKKEIEFSPSMRKITSGRRCRSCAKKTQKKYYNREIHLSYLRKGGKGYERQRVRSKIYFALKSGKLRKSGCLLKNKDCFGRIEAHHYLGYGKEHALDVVWLCSEHHAVIEKMGIDKSNI